MMIVYETLFISTFTISCLRIREASFLDHAHNSSEVQFFVTLSRLPCCAANASISVVEIYRLLNRVVIIYSLFITSNDLTMQKTFPFLSLHQLFT